MTIPRKTLKSSLRQLQCRQTVRLARTVLGNCATKIGDFLRLVPPRQAAAVLVSVLASILAVEIAVGQHWPGLNLVWLVAAAVVNTAGADSSSRLAQSVAAVPEAIAQLTVAVQ